MYRLHLEQQAIDRLLLKQLVNVGEILKPLLKEFDRCFPVFSKTNQKNHHIFLLIENVWHDLVALLGKIFKEFWVLTDGNDTTRFYGERREGRIKS